MATRLEGFALAARQFAVELQKQRARIGQPGQIIGGRRALRLLILQRIFNGQRHLRTDGQQNAKMVGGEGIVLQLVEREHGHHSGKLPPDGMANAERSVLNFVGSLR